jgi:hypothetical protein
MCRCSIVLRQCYSCLTGIFYGIALVNSGANTVYAVAVLSIVSVARASSNVR